jgi:uncharacterized protein (DUF1330 family)
MLADCSNSACGCRDVPVGARSDDVDSDQAGYSLAFARNMVPARMGPYSSSLPPIYQRFSAHYLALGGPGRGVDRLHGDWGDRSLMVGQFPTYAAVAQFWWSPEYRAAAALRAGAVDVDVCRLAGRVPPPEHSQVLVMAFRPGEPRLLIPRWLICARTWPTACASLRWIPQVSRYSKAISRTWKVRVLSYVDRAALEAHWAQIKVALDGRGELQAYAAPRASRG